ncbi:hypothetical protein HanIR_Chr12g0588581 [Helianthus annuus]|nr:hypothetical protein HanIR_Chr12g0588581 [Helianthus annuus]
MAENGSNSVCNQRRTLKDTSFSFFTKAYIQFVESISVLILTIREDSMADCGGYVHLAAAPKPSSSLPVVVVEAKIGCLLVTVAVTKM